MAKRQRLTVEEVLETICTRILDDPEGPIMEGSDDKFPDLEMSDSDNELDNPSSSCIQPQHIHDIAPKHLLPS